MALFPLLLSIALLLAGAHMIAPDHWLPLTAVSSRGGFSRRRTVLIAAILGLLHALTSIGVAVLALFIGVVLIRGYLSLVVSAGEILLVLVAAYFIIAGYLEKRVQEKVTGVSMGYALSVSIIPDLAFLPVILVGANLPLIEISSVVAAFLLMSVISLSLTILAVSYGFGGMLSRLNPKYVDYLIGATLLATAVSLRLI